MIRRDSIRRIRAIAVIAVMFVFASMQGNAQLTITIDSLDASNFPSIAAKISVLDQGFPFAGLEVTDFTVFENGVVQAPITGSCIDSVEQFQSSIMLVLDRSSSMSSGGAWNQLKTAAKTFVDNIGPNESIAVISFSTRGFLGSPDIEIEQDWSKDKNEIKNSIDAMGNPTGRTPLWLAASRGISELISRTDRRIMILMTDGKDNESDPVEYIDVEQAAVANDVTVYTIGLGDQLDITELETLAVATGGDFFQTTNPAQLEQLYLEISRKLTPTGVCELQYESLIDCLNGETVTVEIEVRVGGRTARASATFDLPYDTTTFSYVDVAMNRDFVIESGEQITVPIELTRITDNRPATSFEWEMTYNKLIMRIVEVLPSELTEGYQTDFQETSNGARITLTGTEAVVDSGILAYVTFETTPLNVSEKSEIGISPPDVATSCTFASAENGLITVSGLCERALHPTTEERLETKILPNTPNPFNPRTAIHYSIRVTSHVLLTVYSAAGEKIATLFDAELPRGQYTSYFDGAGLPSGNYFVHLVTDDGTDVRQIVLSK